MRSAQLFLTAVGALTLSLALTACTAPGVPATTDAASPSAAAPTTAPPAAPLVCQNDFSAELESSPSDDGLNRPTGIVVLTNDGEAPCDLTGFPDGFGFVNDGVPLNLANGDAGPVDSFHRAATTVTVAPGDTAYIWIWFHRAPPPGDPIVCESPTPATALALTLPGATAPVEARAEIELCADGERAFLYGPVDSKRRVASTGY